MILLNSLPRSHPLRERPLGEIHTEIRTKQMAVWIAIEYFGIEKATFNQLPKVWTDNNEFRAHDSE